jgi:ABC-type proline/glycine betaine transport system permease subunit
MGTWDDEEQEEQSTIAKVAFFAAFVGLLVVGQAAPPLAEMLHDESGATLLFLEAVGYFAVGVMLGIVTRRGIPNALTSAGLVILVLFEFWDANAQTLALLLVAPALGAAVGWLVKGAKQDAGGSGRG